MRSSSAQASNSSCGLKEAAAVGGVAVEGQVEFQVQAVSQKLDAALNSAVAVAEGPEHGGGVRAQRHGIREAGQMGLALVIGVV